MKTPFTPLLQQATFLSTFCLLVFCTLFAQGQKSDFYAMLIKKDKYYDSLIKARGSNNMQGTGYKDYLRWKAYWIPKIGNSENQVDAYNAIRNYTENYNTIKNNFSIISQNWISLGPFSRPNNIPSNYTVGMAGVGRIHAFSFDPNNQSRIYAMSPSWGGLFRSDNSGSSWTKIQTDDVTYEGFSFLHVDRTNSNNLFLVNGDNSANYYSSGGGLSQNTGIFRTTNGGSSWTQIFNTNGYQRHRHIRKLLQTATNTTLLAATDYGLYVINNMQSSINDTTKAWDVTNNCPMNYSIIDIEIRPTFNNEIYASGRDGKYLFKSTDGGNNWNKINNPFIVSDTLVFADTLIVNSNIEFSAADPNTLYFLSEQKVRGYGQTFCILYSYNLISNQWIVKDSLYTVNGLDKGFVISPTNPNLMFIGGMLNFPIYKSIDGGNTFSPMEKYYHVDIHDLKVNNANQELWAATDGGIHKYNIATETWTDVTNMSISNIGHREFSVSQSDTNYAVMGCYDNGSNLLDKSNTSLSKWSYRDVGDGNSCVFDYADANTFYTSVLGGVIKRQNRSNPATGITLYPIPYPSKDYNSLVIDAGNHNLIYMITKTDVYRSFSRGDDGTWEKISDNLNTGNATRNLWRLYTSTNTPGVLYLQNLYYDDTIAHQRYQKMWRTFNANANSPQDVTWEPYTYRDTILFNDLVLDPINPRSGWGALQGYGSAEKIMRFTESGWTDISYNLSTDLLYTIPTVYCLAFDKTSPTERLYVGTQYGVYYLDKGTTQWKLLDGMPDAEITNLEIQNISGKLFASTYGKGVWETNIQSTSCSGPIAITADSTLTGGGMSLCGFIVKPGKTFTVKGMLTMGQNAKIVVERGAKLIVDGGTITGLPGFTWQGIEVWGDSSKTQANNAVYQGMAKFINNSVVENARVGAVTIKNEGTPNYAYTGGIIQATDATFRNCIYGVVFYKYENRNPLNNKPLNNASAFTRVIFETNNNYVGTDTIRNFAHLSEVRGIYFKGCTFGNTNSTAIGNKATGIFSFNSAMGINSICKDDFTPCKTIQNSLFAGLRYGIRALGAATTKTFSISNAVFTANKCGIYANAIDYIKAVQNTFNITKNDTAQNSANPLGGMFVDQCKFYTIEENTFNKLNSAGGLNDKYVGLTISNSGPDNNQVYKNTFNNLDIGILAQGINKNPSNSGQGLCLRCNNFNTCKYDIAVTKPSNGNYTDNGVALWQGSSTDPVGNLFTDLSQNPTYQFWNLYTNHVSVPDIMYFHHRNIDPYPRLKPVNNKITNLVTTATQIDYDPINSCPSHLNVNPNPSDKIMYDNKADSVSTILQQLIDAGNTDELANEVTTSFPTEALELRDELIEISPFVSYTVLHLAIEKESVLNNALLRDVLVANSQSAKSEVLMEAINQRWEPMPDYMKDEILEGSTIVSEKEKLEAELSNFRHKSEVFYNRMISNYLLDTLNINARDSAFSLISQSEYLGNQYSRAIIAAERNDTILCGEILDNIEQTWYPNGNIPFELLTAMQYFQTSRNQNVQNLPIQLLDSAQLIPFYGLQANSDFAGNWARNILIAANKVTFNEQYMLPDELKTTEVLQISKKPRSENSFLKAFPNPTKEYVIFEYNIGETEFSKNANISVHDSKGVLQEQMKLYRPVDQVVYDTRALKTGIYFCSLISGKTVLGSLKLNIIK